MNEQDGAEEMADSLLDVDETGAQNEAFGVSDGPPGSPEPERALAAVSGRRLVLALGGVYVALAVTYPFLPIVDDSSFDLWAVLGVLVGGPGLVLLYGGYRLPRTDIRPELYSTVSKWCLRGVALGLGIMVPIVLASGDSAVVPNTVLLTALGSIAGFAAGIHDARAKTRQLELQETIDQLETSNERLEQFAYAASHDLQEPLRMVSSYLQLVETRYRDDLDEDGLEFIDFAVDGADRMRAMIDSLLDYSRVTTRGDPLELTDAGAVLEGVLDELRPQIEATSATVTVDELPTVTADADQLAQLFEHLLGNAMEYSGSEAPRVHVSAERTGDRWRFSVTDEGVGIDPEFHDRIFEVFEKVHAGSEAPEIGSGGIGLALCKRIVERHGGDIWVESSPGDGATFSFTLSARER